MKNIKSTGPDIAIVGAGPVGLWSAIQIKRRRPDFDVRIHERYETYQRSHVLRVEHLSMLLYGKNSNDPAEQEFNREITGKSLSQMFLAAAGSVFIRTNDLEKALKSHAAALGIKTTHELVESPEQIMHAYPDCRYFIAADGAHSRMRTALLGEDATKPYALQHVAEVKYQVQGRAGHLDFFDDNYKANKLLSNMVFEYVGREKEGVTPVTLRFFLDRKTYEEIPKAEFKNPVLLSDPRISEEFSRDVQTYMNIRQSRGGENYIENSGKLTKLILSMYAARKFAVKKNEQAWFLVGDAAMGVPYFRALNSGLIIGSQLGFILTRDWLSAGGKVKAYNACRPLDVAWEFTAAQGKNICLNLYDHFRQASAKVPWEAVKYAPEDASEFRSRHHRAFRPGDDPGPG